jgi:dipeptidyl aminopeptidase/acylaminoacyl peptidase
MVARAGTGLSNVWLVDGVAWWLESRPAEAGRVVLMRADPNAEPRDVTPDRFSVRTRVHEYGGGAYCVQGATVYFTNHADQRLYRQDPELEPVAITPDVPGHAHRYADGRVTADGRLWIGVRERHEGTRPEEVVNELVVLPTDGSSDPVAIVAGRDFYSNPRIAPGDARICFLAWDLPWMPWDGCELFVADLGRDGVLSGLDRVAGQDGEEAIWEPEWSPAGELVFASDRSGWWNLERIRGGERTLLYPAEAEFGYPAWVFGSRSYGFLADGRIACAYDRDAHTRFAVLDPERHALVDLDVPHHARSASVFLAAEGTTVAFIAGSATLPNQVVRLQLATGALEILRSSAQVPVDESYFSVPRAIDFPTEAGLTAHALFYPPRNPAYVAPADERPPLVVWCHGGPTDNAAPLFSLRTQFWTSRGFAIVDVNYGGSTGYGRAYRERLNGLYGVVDVQDCVNAARYLVDQGEVDGDRLLIRGGSSGGYTTVCALTFTDLFAAGSSYYGIVDLEPTPEGNTIKFELEHDQTLVGPYPEAAELFRARSPIHFADRITTPMLVLQGTDDEVVPPVQAERIVAALRERGVPHAYLLFEGEGHGFRRAETAIRSLEAELSFYLQVLQLQSLDDVPRLAIEHLPA